MVGLHDDQTTKPIQNVHPAREHPRSIPLPLFPSLLPNACRAAVTPVLSLGAIRRVVAVASLQLYSTAHLGRQIPNLACHKTLATPQNAFILHHHHDHDEHQWNDSHDD